MTWKPSPDKDEAVRGWMKAQPSLGSRVRTPVVRFTVLQPVSASRAE
jgi:hypothetical protein